MCRITKNICLGFACLLAIVASGCVETSMMFQGNLVEPVRVVALQEGGPHSGSWKTFDLVIDYKYFRNDNILEISGQINMSEHYQMNYNSLSKLFVYLFLIDSRSRVLSSDSLVKAVTGDLDENLTFSRSYNVPAGTVGISFGYNGSVREFREINDFYQLPLRHE